MPSGHHENWGWRLAIASKLSFSDKNGAFLPEYPELVATYCCGAEDEYFQWRDTKGDSARDLANKFIERFPELCRAGKGRDWEYAGWLAELVGFLEGGDYLPYVCGCPVETLPYSLNELPIGDYTAIRMFPEGFPLPPPGDLRHDDRDLYGRLKPIVWFSENPDSTSDPYDLGAKEAVESLVGDYYDVLLKRESGELDDVAVGAMIKRMARIFAGLDSEFKTLPDWHTREALGNALVRFFELDGKHLGDEDLEYCLEAAFTDIQRRFEPFFAAAGVGTSNSWASIISKSLDTRLFVHTVLLGNNAESHPGKTLSDFLPRP